MSLPNLAAAQELIRSARRVERVSLEVDHSRVVVVWTLGADGREVSLEGGPEQLPGMLRAAAGLLAGELGAGISRNWEL